MESKRKRMKKIIEKFKEYVATYDKQHFVYDHSDEIFIKDMIYGIGIAIDGKYQMFEGFKKFKEELNSNILKEVKVEEFPKKG